MSSRKVIVELTLPQARALWSAARYCDEFPEDTERPAAEQMPLHRAVAKLDAAVDAAEASR